MFSEKSEKKELDKNRWEKCQFEKNQLVWIKFYRWLLKVMIFGECVILKLDKFERYYLKQ